MFLSFRGFIFLDIPIDSGDCESSNSHTMTEFIKRETETVMRNISPMEFLLFNIFMSSPVSFLKYLSPKFRDILVSNMMGPSRLVKVWEYPVEKIQFWVESHMSYPIVFSVFSYNGFINISIMGNSPLISNEDDLKELGLDVQRSLESLLEFK